jgi:hypothetical protein
LRIAARSIPQGREAATASLNWKLAGMRARRRAATRWAYTSQHEAPHERGLGKKTAGGFSRVNKHRHDTLSRATLTGLVGSAMFGVAALGSARTFETVPDFLPSEIQIRQSTKLIDVIRFGWASPNGLGLQ